jgi:hypothetical protein
MLARWIGLIIIGSYALETHAWSDMGHKLVCDIAYEYLDPGVKNTVKNLIKALPDEHKVLISEDEVPNFGDLCPWPDKIRSLPEYKAVATWHYVNVDRNDSSMHRSYCVTGCILNAIDQHKALLANRQLSAWARLQAMMFLGHWLGDIHQPLHASFADDRGGNLVRVSGFEKCKNLHGVWDYCLIAASKKSRQDLQQLLSMVARNVLAQRINRSLDPLEWANESLAIARHPRTRYCEITESGCQRLASRSFRLPADYYSQNWPVVKHRLALAGIRLAELLNRVLAAPLA